MRDGPPRFDHCTGDGAAMKELQVTIYLDREFEDLKTTKSVSEGCTIADLKAELARDDPTGNSNAEDFILAKWSRDLALALVPLADAVPISTVGADLLICSPDDVKEVAVDLGSGESKEDHLKATCPAEPQQSPARPRWEVIGGADRGGILVREGQDLSSTPIATRLATGSIVDEMELLGERLHYSLVTGSGPKSGWVSIVLKGKELLVPADSASPAGTRLGMDLTWPDLDGQAVGPWKPHEDKVTKVFLDRLNKPPHKSRRLYTTCWMEAKICSWDVSKASIPGRAKPPYLNGELVTRGLVSDMAVITEDAVLTAISANPLPEGGVVCHQADYKQRMTEQDDQLKPGDTLIAWDLRAQPFQKKSTSLAVSEPAIPVAPKKIPLHVRGCHALSIWPTPRDGLAPQMVASISDDVLGLSRIVSGGIGLEEPALWKVSNPHGGMDGGPASRARHILWAGPENLWSSSKTGGLKAWDVHRGDARPVSEADLSVHSLTSIVLQSEIGLLMAGHDAGISFFDTRTRATVQQQYTKNPVSTLSVLPDDSSILFAGTGTSLLQYEVRMLGGNTGSKPKVVGTWDLPSDIGCLDCLCSPKGTTLVAVGCKGGHVATFDAS